MLPSGVTYVRHAMPVADPGTTPSEWHLDGDGRHEAALLADRLEVAPRIGALVSSTEPKAIETAEAVGARWEAEVLVDGRLREVARPWVGDGYRHVAHRYLRGDLPAGWEPHEQVAARAAAALAEATSLTSGPVVLVTHGLLLSVHLADLLGDGFDREGFWSCLSFPDAWSLHAPGTIHRPLATTR
jgi:broad specificity phosphatase PhoE